MHAPKLTPPRMFEMITLAEHGHPPTTVCIPKTGTWEAPVFTAPSVEMLETSIGQQFMDWWDEEFEQFTGALPPFSRLIHLRELERRNSAAYIPNVVTTKPCAGCNRTQQFKYPAGLYCERCLQQGRGRLRPIF